MSFVKKIIKHVTEIILKYILQKILARIVLLFLALGGIGIVVTYWNIWLGSLIILSSIFMFCWKEYRERKNKYISLQEAAKVLSDSVKNISRECIDSVTPINRSDPFDEFEYKRANPDKIHKETLPKITIGLINLTLHICKKNNVKVYGKSPSFSDRIMIPFEKIQFFSADHTRLYDNRSRDTRTLIYSDVAVMKKDFENAINNTGNAEFERIVYDL